MIEEFLNEGSVKERDLREALNYIKQYFGDENFFIKRSDVNNGGNDFRSYLEREIKSRLRVNKMILVLDRFFEFVVNYNKIMNNDGIKINPFSREWDYYKTSSYKGTKRLALELNVIEDLKSIVLEQEESSVRNLIYMLLCLPLRGSQVQLLDSGWSDDLVYIDGQMVKNKDGIKGRAMGVLQVINGQKYFFINTNKNGQGFLVKCRHQILWRILENQREWVKGLDRNMVGKEALGRVNVKVLREKYDLLFRNDDGRSVNKSQMYKFWNKVCMIADERFDYGLCENGKFIYDLHSLRVSLISHYSEVEGLDVISKHISGQESLAIVFGYCKSNKDLGLSIKQREQQKMLEYQGVAYEK